MVNHGVFGESWGLVRQRKTPSITKGFLSVPREGLEPTLPEGKWILNRVSFRLYSPHDTLLPSERVTHPELPCPHKLDQY